MVGPGKAWQGYHLLMKARSKTVSELIDALGGTTAVAIELDIVPSAVSNWKKAGKFPANTYIKLIAMLQDKGIFPPPHLWDMK
jgi:hypothetical protein